MTDDMIMVQWADVTGGGFRRHEVGTPAPREYWAAAEQLLRTDLSQPPEDIRSTVGHPVWTLRRVAVRGRKTWCFVVQGRRGPFGVAGACRFAFAPETMPAFEAWHAGRELAAEPEETAEVEGSVFADVLGGIVAGQQAVPADVSPGGAADLIPRVLGVLPEAVAREFSWSTCTLKRPEVRRVVSGRWPDEFRGGDPARASMIDQVFRHGPVPQDEVKRQLGSEEAMAGFEWLVSYALEGSRPSAELLAYDDLRRMITDLGQDKRPPDLRQVPGRLRTARGRDSLRGNLDLVRGWALQQPYAARRELDGLDDPPLRAALLRGLVEAQNETAENVLGVPPAEDLTELYSHKELRAILTRWTAPGGVLADLDERAAARDWFFQLGFTVASDPLLFQPRPHFVADTVNRQGGLTEDAFREIRTAPSPLIFLEQAVAEVKPLPPRQAGALLLCAVPDVARLPDGDGRALRGLAYQLTAAGLPSGGRWVDDFLGYVRQKQRHAWEARTVMYGAMTALLERRPGEPGPELARLCLEIGADGRAPALVAEALELARRRAEVAAAQPPPRGSVYPSRAALAQRFHRAFPPRVRGYVAVGIMSAVIGAAVTGAFTIPGRPSSAVAGPGPSIAPAAAQTVDPLPMDLGGFAGRGDQARIDLRNFLGFYQKAPAGSTPAAVLLIADGGDDRSGLGVARANALHDALRTGPFTEVPVEVVDKPARGPGTLRAIVFFNRP